MNEVTMVACTNQKPKEFADVLDGAVHVIDEKFGKNKSWSEVGVSSIPKLMTALDGIGDVWAGIKKPGAVMAVADAGTSIYRVFKNRASTPAPTAPDA